MIVSFKSYMMNFMDFVFDCYSHITSHVSQVFAKLHTLHKLLFTKHCTCNCVCLWFDQPSLKIPWVLCKTYLMLENLKGECLKILILEQLGLELVFLKKYFISYSSILFIKFNTLRSFCTKFAMFFKNVFFPEFQSIEAVFRSIKISIKNLSESLSVSIDRT